VLPHFLGPHARQSTLHTGPRDTSKSSVSTGPASGGTTRGFACMPGEGVRDATSFRRTRHYFPSPPNLSYLSLLSLSSPKPPDDFSSTADNCTDGGCPAASPLPRIEGEQASGRTSTAACKMSVSTLNPHLVHSVSLHDIRRRALHDMHISSHDDVDLNRHKF
jgi:hypothetical protein